MRVTNSLQVRIGQISEKGLKHQNEDSIGLLLPEEPALTLKGMVALVADGVSTAEAGKEASETCVKNFVSDYYSTPDSWSVKTSAQRILTALNRWLYGQGLNFLRAERGYISTLSALVIKARTAHLFHIGDSRIYRLRAGELEQLTRDHSAPVGKESSYLTRAMGMDLKLDIDYYTHELQQGDLFFLSTDGVHDFIPHSALKQTLLDSVPDGVLNCDGDLQACCAALIEQALANHSDDNLSCQLILIEQLPETASVATDVPLADLPIPTQLNESDIVDGYQVLARIPSSSRSQLYHVAQIETQQQAVMKLPAVDFLHHSSYKEHFIMERWIAQRVNSEHVAKIVDTGGAQQFLYYVYDYVPGQTLAQWRQAHPKPSIERVLGIVQQIVKGARALHRKETLHQNLRPENIIIDETDHITLIDFGFCSAAGMSDPGSAGQWDASFGVGPYAAPEYHLGQRGTVKSEQFAIAVVLYQLLTGEYPYGPEFEACRTLKEFNRLSYRPARTYNPMVPDWMDGALHKALNPAPELRYEALSEFVYDLEHPNPAFAKDSYASSMQRNSLRFWQITAGVLVVMQVLTLWLWLGNG